MRVYDWEQCTVALTTLMVTLMGPLPATGYSTAFPCGQSHRADFRIAEKAPIFLVADTQRHGPRVVATSCLDLGMDGGETFDTLAEQAVDGDAIPHEIARLVATTEIVCAPHLM